MKNFNRWYLYALIALLFSGCTKDDEPDYADLIQGQWVNTLINGQTVLTDATFVMEFKSDHTELYASGFQWDENNKSWEENSSYTYSIKENLITIDGTDVLDDSYHMVFKILSLSQEVFTYSIPEFTLNGEEIADTQTYSCVRVENENHTEFPGVWYGHCITEGSADSLYHYWHYFADGTYDYYYQDGNSNWIKKTDNNGHYYLYGQLMASNYSHDLLLGGTGRAYECWNFTLDGNTMVWTGWRENGVTITYEMEKVASPPETLKCVI
ncbi:MAG: hypothetical protein PHU97_10215 [Bacteroidales bacterium]|nr:hypothetical protein [Bacteroidales bacterium]